MPKFTDRLMHAWNAFRNTRDPTFDTSAYGSSFRPDRLRLNVRNDRSIVTALLNRIAIDCAACSVRHAQTDTDGRYLFDRDSGLNNALRIEANLDQTGRAMMQDLVLTMLDEGCAALVPVDTTIDPTNSNAYDIETLRVGSIAAWCPEKVRIRLYNQSVGRREEVVLPKKMVAIIENPLYAVINEPNSTYQRLVRKLNLLDRIDDQVGSGKLDMIIQLPYIINTETRRKQAEIRRQDIENQLAGSKYGIAYTGTTEKIQQLNRPLENNLLDQIKDLTGQLFSQIGFTEEVFNGTADEKTMLNYYNRTIEPIMSAITDEMKRKFLSKTARTQGQSILFFRDPFKLVPVENIADIADKFTRNAILSSNELRQIVGFKPSDDPDADVLRNKNLNESDAEIDQHLVGDGQQDQYLDIWSQNQNGSAGAYEVPYTIEGEGGYGYGG